MNELMDLAATMIVLALLDTLLEIILPEGDLSNYVRFIWHTFSVLYIGINLAALVSRVSPDSLLPALPKTEYTEPALENPYLQDLIRFFRSAIRLPGS